MINLTFCLIPTSFFYPKFLSSPFIKFLPSLPLKAPLPPPYLPLPTQYITLLPLTLPLPLPPFISLMQSDKQHQGGIELESRTKHTPHHTPSHHASCTTPTPLPPPHNTLPAPHISLWYTRTHARTTPLPATSPHLSRLPSTPHSHHLLCPTFSSPHFFSQNYTQKQDSRA